MTEGPLAGAETKLARAREHLKRLRSESTRFLEGDPYRIVVDFDAKSGWYFIKARIVEQAPVELSVTVGEFAYECVSALNHAVWQLAARKRGRLKIEGKKLRDQIQFPVAYSRERFMEKGIIKQGHVSQAAVAVIHELQPYYRFNGKARAKTHSLSLLKALADSDKHRVLAPRLGSLDLGPLIVGWDPVAGEPRQRYFPRKHRTLDDGTKLMQIRFGVGNAQANVHVQGDLSPEIAFGTGEFLIGLGHLDNAAAYMDTALRKLGTLFT